MEGGGRGGGGATAADAPLGIAITVADGAIRRIAVEWGTAASRWSYVVTYEGLGATPAIQAPANARSLLEERRKGARDER